MIDSLLRSYCDYYAKLGHSVLPRYSLLHPAFKTSFVLSAGVIDMKQKLDGDTGGPLRSLLIQPCFRHFDIATVVTGRHLSLFLMGAALYFDKSSCRTVVEAALRFLIEELSIDSSKLWLTTFGGGNIGGHTISPDEESLQAWSSLRLPVGRVLQCGVNQNFWHEGAGSGEVRSGLCGPHTEIFIDRGGTATCNAASCIPGCGCGRFLELANVVFPRFRLVDNRLEPIPWVLAEAALGLERVAMLLESAHTMFDTTALAGLKEAALGGPLAGIEDIGASLTVLDHVRSFCCLVAEGAYPSARGRGHILRRLLRNAIKIVRRFSCCPAETLAGVADLVAKHPEACCTIDVASNWQHVSEVFSQELCVLAQRAAVEQRK